jgi:hypothetical protein
MVLDTPVEIVKGENSLLHLKSQRFQGGCGGGFKTQ